MGKAPPVASGAELEDGDQSFAYCLREVRRRTLKKQACLSAAVGCSDATISFWESGFRLPTDRNLQRLLTAIASCGGTTAELLGLRAAWFRERTRRSLQGTGAPKPRSTAQGT
ncbi:MAG TPA: helix-turn-helix transcriptional regulator [Polyangiaceae bacterium]|nr:helix-turn-helix transcriptional regulator [Polyangiaceae bacterium]